MHRIHSWIALAGCLAVSQAVQGQEPSAFQVGAQFATLRVGDLGTTNGGVGGRVSFALSRWAGIDGEFNVFPNDTFETDGTSLAQLRLSHRRRRIDAFVGPKLGWSWQRFGVFGAVKPGFSHLTDRGIQCAGSDCAVILLALPVYRTEFAIDFGGVFEVYPTARIVARVDVSDTFIRHRSFAPPCTNCSTHNLSTRFGFGVRF
jgi:hypothetical protein